MNLRMVKLTVTFTLNQTYRCISVVQQSEKLTHRPQEARIDVLKDFFKRLSFFLRSRRNGANYVIKNDL